MFDHPQNTVVKHHQDLTNTRSVAAYSPCEQYRYLLMREWEAAEPKLAFMMLNPSTATELANDPTIARCETRARQNGYGGLIITNIFAYRATLPEDMKAQTDPVGSENDNYLGQLLTQAQQGKCEVVCAWGVHGNHNNRTQEILKIFEQFTVTPKVLELTQHGIPRHPLYISYSKQPQVWSAAS